MSVHEDALRDLAANHGWGFCDAVADEINDLEASYASLFKTHGELQSDLAAAQEKNAKLKSHAEALHLQLKRFIGDHFFAAPHTSITTDEAWEAKQVADAYSRDFPKEGT